MWVYACMYVFVYVCVCVFMHIMLLLWLFGCCIGNSGRRGKQKCIYVYVYVYVCGCVCVWQSIPKQSMQFVASNLKSSHIHTAIHTYIPHIFVYFRICAYNHHADSVAPQKYAKHNHIKQFASAAIQNDWSVSTSGALRISPQLRRVASAVVHFAYVCSWLCICMLMCVRVVVSCLQFTAWFALKLWLRNFWSKCWAHD